MCGIFALLNTVSPVTSSKETIQKQFDKCKGRGPENSQLIDCPLNVKLGFHRLAINGLDNDSNQPFNIDGCYLICNGEIYNYKELFQQMDIKPQTHSDCEVIIHLYRKYGIQQTLTMLDGVFAFVLYDTFNARIFVARDPFGVRPLYTFMSSSLGLQGFASELKCLVHFNNNYNGSLTHFQPGTYTEYEFHTHYLWNPVSKISVPYFIPTFAFKGYVGCKESVDELNTQKYLDNIRVFLYEAVSKRCTTTERPIACLLSGGLDSSLIAALVNQCIGDNKPLHTFSIGLPGSEDLACAQIVAKHLGSIHTEVVVSEQDMFDAIPEVIKAIESYDTTTVRASIGNYLLGKYIAANSDAKVIFNGDGSDELFGGYLYMNKCPDSIEFDKETRRLLQDIHAFDVLRSDKCISTHGLEPRTPFLDRSFVNTVLAIPTDIRNHVAQNKMEKYLLREAFTHLLPPDILWRRKEAFSDGVSCKGRSLYTILQENIALHYNWSLNPSIDLEKRYYRDIFDAEFPECRHIVPYAWMPKFVKSESNDPSARTLPIY